MYPSYARIRSFDESHTKFASKYSLYLYREQGKDKIPEKEGDGFQTLDGIPALFIPGNAGSYRQARSIAAECSNLYFDKMTDQYSNENAKNIDFFAAEFNEDFTAFHGRTLLDQAEYLNEAVRFILLLYTHTKTPPTSVLIIAHSMGGIVARVMLSLPSYQENSINTILTLASPHAAAPLTFDSDILKLYLAADRFWHEGFHSDQSLAHERLKDVALISITGGMSDTVLPADYTTLGFLVPPSNGFTAYTTGIPDVWTPMDHLAIVWCRQLRRVVLRAILEIVDASSPSRTYSLEKRMAVFKRHFLSGFEKYAMPKPLLTTRSTFALKLDEDEVSRQDSPAMTWRNGDVDTLNKFVVHQLHKGSRILMVSDFKLPQTEISEMKRHAEGVFLCKESGKSDHELDYTKPLTQNSLTLHCLDLTQLANNVPNSSPNAASPADSAIDGDLKPFRALTLSDEELGDFNHVVVFRDHIMASDGFLTLSVSKRNESESVLNVGLAHLLYKGASTELPSSQPLAVNLKIKGAWSSLIKFRVKVTTMEPKLFQPFVRQWTDHPYETKWTIGLSKESIFRFNAHSVAPYTPFRNAKLREGVDLQLWADIPQPTKETFLAPTRIEVSVDWHASLMLLVSRYRLAVVSQCLAVALLVFAIQLETYLSSKKMPDYTSSLSRLTSARALTIAFLVLTALTPLTKLRTVQSFLNRVDPVVLQDPYEINESLDPAYTLNAFYLGLQETCLSFLGPLFYCMAIGLNHAVIYVFEYACFILTTMARGMNGAVRRILRRKETEPSLETKSHLKGKLVTSAVLLVMIPLYVPYQFAYIICYGIHIKTCVDTYRSGLNQSVQNFNLGLLMVMSWVLPINIPVVIVFVHNFNSSWITPFSSHHNFLAVAPILALVQLCNFQGDKLISDILEAGRLKRWLSRIVTSLLVYTAFYSLLYGTRHTYWLHHLFNFWCCWILLLAIGPLNTTEEKMK